MTWTVEALLEHVTRMLEERDRRYQQRFDAQEKALAEAEQASVEQRSQASIILTLAVASAGLLTAIVAIVLSLVTS